MGVASSIANHVFPLRVTSSARWQELPTIHLRQRRGAVTTTNASRAERGDAMLLTRSQVADNARRVVSLDVWPSDLNVIYATICAIDAATAINAIAAECERSFDGSKVPSSFEGRRQRPPALQVDVITIRREKRARRRLRHRMRPQEVGRMSPGSESTLHCVPVGS